jgi:hypothetical protein
MKIYPTPKTIKAIAKIFNLPTPPPPNAEFIIVFMVTTSISIGYLPSRFY